MSHVTIKLNCGVLGYLDVDVCYGVYGEGRAIDAVILRDSRGMIEAEFSLGFFPAEVQDDMREAVDHAIAERRAEAAERENDRRREDALFEREEANAINRGF